MDRPITFEMTLVSVDGLLAGASNATLLARDSEGNPWVYKPEQGERPLWDFPYGSLARREVACYRVAEVLRLGVVPETFVTEGPYGPGSAQRFLEEDFQWDPRPSITSADPALWPIAVLDVIVNNADRKIGHLVREPDGDRIWAIDNGLTFHTEEKLRTVLWSFAGREVPPPLIQHVDVGPVRTALEDLLGPEEVEMTVTRLERLMADPVHPQPPQDRPPLPWPVW